MATPRALIAAIVTMLILWPHSASGQGPVDPQLAVLQAQIDARGEVLRRLRQQLDQQFERQLEQPAHPVAPWDGSVSQADLDSCDPGAIQRLPLVIESPPTSACGQTSDSDKFHQLTFYADYDNGFVIRPFDPQRHPFELKVGGWIQFRHHGFTRSSETWTDNAGVTRDIRNRNAFDIERARLTLGGYAVDERLTYFYHLDGDTDGEHTVDFFDYWWAWQFSDSFQVQLGKRKVPGSRQWLLGARHTRFVDRPMANDFFRPDRTVGIFGIGKLGDTGHYELMVGNGYSSANVPNSDSDNLFTFAATNYFDPWGDYGGQIVDFAGTDQPLVRLGHSAVYSPQQGFVQGRPLGEADFVRLSDGTRLTQPGALAPGVTVSDFDIYFYGLDAALKWRGWSANAELFLRWIDQIEGNGPLPETRLFQHGGYVEGGVFLVPQVLDVNARHSWVSGQFGDATEYSAGVNWYPLAKPTMKLSCDVTALDGSPLQNTTSDILAGDEGVLFRTQFQAEF